MATESACGDPLCFNEQESARFFGDTNGVYRGTRVESVGETTATIDGVALKPGDSITISNQSFAGVIVSSGLVYKSDVQVLMERIEALEAKVKALQDVEAPVCAAANEPTYEDTTTAYERAMKVVK